MKVRFVAIFAVILMVIGIVISCFDYAKTTPSSNGTETQATQESKTTEETEVTKTTEETQEPETTEEAEPETTQPSETTGDPETEATQPSETTGNPEKEETTGKTEKEETQATETTKETTSSEGKEGDSGSKITFESKYICEDGVMPYALYTPSTIDESKKTPLIVWLHGSGEVGVGEETFFNSGLLKTLNKWKRQGFNAYVICPHLSGNYNTGRWNKESTRDNLKALLDKFIEDHNIDVDRIIVVGHSLGGQGALYMAYELPEYFSRCVVLSGYNPGIDITKIKIPTIGFVGTESAGEDTGSISYMKQYFMEVFGDENTFFFETSHGGIPSAAFSFDTDDDDKSDLIEWMFGEFEF